MLDTLQNQDTELDLLDVTKQDIINALTIEDIEHFLESLGVTQIQINKEHDCLICPTICHNPINEAASMKLYWYQNNKIFKCYTECNEAMSIFTLYKKYMALNYYPISDDDAVDYVRRTLKHLIITHSTTAANTTIDASKYKFTAHLPQLEEYNPCVLDCFIDKPHPTWLKEGITEEVMKKFDIKFSISHNSIVIPVYDINHRLVGIRERVLDEQQIQEFGKYHPVTIGNINYRHSNQFNLYGICEHQGGIVKRHSAILVEGEKSVLLDDVYYGQFANSVAVLGNHTNKYQISLLTDILQVNEIIIAFDKEYDSWYDEDAKQYRKIIEQLCHTYRGHASFSYIWDYDNVLKRKDSPYDRGKEVFEHLYKTRVKVR